MSNIVEQTVSAIALSAIEEAHYPCYDDPCKLCKLIADAYVRRARLLEPGGIPPPLPLARSDLTCLECGCNASRLYDGADGGVCISCHLK